MKRFSLQTLLLLVALFAVSAALWAEHFREPEVYFLHVYSNRYGPSHDYRHPDHGVETTHGINSCLLTIAIRSGTPFYALVPNNYSPTITVDGTLTKQRSEFTGTVVIDIEDAGTAFGCSDITTLPVDTLVPFWDKSHHIAVSFSSDPYELNYDVGELF